MLRAASWTPRAAIVARLVAPFGPVSPVLALFALTAFAALTAPARAATGTSAAASDDVSGVHARDGDEIGGWGGARHS